MENISGLMTQYWWLLVVGIVLFIVAKKLGKAFGGDAVEITVEQVVELIASKQALLIDLAEKRTYEKGYIPGSVNMPGIMFIDGSAHLEDTSRPVILVPMKGLIPMPVVQYMNSVGVTELYIFKGGLKEWQAAGHPIEN